MTANLTKTKSLLSNELKGRLQIRHDAHQLHEITRQNSGSMYTPETLKNCVGIRYDQSYVLLKFKKSDVFYLKDLCTCVFVPFNWFEEGGAQKFSTS